MSRGNPRDFQEPTHPVARQCVFSTKIYRTLQSEGLPNRFCICWCDFHCNNFRKGLIRTSVFMFIQHNVCTKNMSHIILQTGLWSETKRKKKAAIQATTVFLEVLLNVSRSSESLWFVSAFIQLLFDSQRRGNCNAEPKVIKFIALLNWSLLWFTKPPQPEQLFSVICQRFFSSFFVFSEDLCGASGTCSSTGKQGDQSQALSS